MKIERDTSSNLPQVYDVEGNLQIYGGFIALESVLYGPQT